MKLNLQSTYLLIILIFTLSAGRLYAAERKAVAVLPFKNTNKSARYDYLSESLPEAVITSVAELKRFKLIDRDAIRGAMQKSKLQASGLTESKAREVSKVLSADIYITGSFMAMKGSILMNARIFNAETGEVLAAARKQSKLDQTIFENIDVLSKDLAKNLDKAVPKDRVVTVTQYIGGSSGFMLSASGMFVLPSVNMQAFDPGIGASFEFGRGNMLVNNLYIGLSAGMVNHGSPKQNVESLSVLPVQAIVGYDLVPFGNYRPFLLRPYLAGGMDFGTYSGDVSGSTSIRLPNAAAGLKLMHHISSGLYFMVDGRFQLQFDNSMHGFIYTGGGVAYQL